MTEYDWSPEAWERHLEQQQRVSNWVTEQNSRLPQYQHSKYRAGSVAPSHNTHSSHQPSSHTRHRSRSSSTTSPTSSTPTKARPSRPDHKRSLTEPLHEAYTTSHRSSRSRTRQTSPPPAYHQPTSPTYVSHAYAPQTTSYPHHSKRSGDYRTQTYTYDAATGQIVLPPPRAGEKYIIVPPADRQLVVVNNDPYTIVQHGSRSSSNTSSSKNQPLLKRLFSGLSPSRSSPNAKLSRRSASRDGRVY